jgi:hypothetical protein
MTSGMWLNSLSHPRVQHVILYDYIRCACPDKCKSYIGIKKLRGDKNPFIHSGYYIAQPAFCPQDFFCVTNNARNKEHLFVNVLNSSGYKIYHQVQQPAVCPHSTCIYVSVIILLKTNNN